MCAKWLGIHNKKVSSGKRNNLEILKTKNGKIENFASEKF